MTLTFAIGLAACSPSDGPVIIDLRQPSGAGGDASTSSSSSATSSSATSSSSSSTSTSTSSSGSGGSGGGPPACFSCSQAITADVPPSIDDLCEGKSHDLWYQVAIRCACDGACEPRCASTICAVNPSTIS